VTVEDGLDVLPQVRLLAPPAVFTPPAIFAHDDAAV
jgi:hypothetical protein